MALVQAIRNQWQEPTEAHNALWKQRLIAWRREQTITRIERPTRLDAAKASGYRAKQGIFLIRIRVPRGGHRREHSPGGRRSHTMRTTLALRKGYRHIAEERVSRQFPNCEVLNSYYCAQDGKHYWFEVIMVDRDHPAVRNDPRLGWISSGKHKGRAARGLTAAGAITRGQTGKGKGYEKAYPSRRANKRLH